MAYIGTPPSNAFTSLLKQDFSTSATTGYTLDHAVNNANDIALFINFVRQEPTAAYSASGTTLTLTSATASTDDMYCVYLGQALQTVNPPNASVGISQLTATGTKDATTFLRGDNSFAVAGGDNTPAFLASLSANQTIANNTYTKVQLNNEILDTDNCYDNTTNYRFTPTTAGYYWLFASGRFDGGGSDQPHRHLIRKNNIAVSQIQTIWSNATATQFIVSGIHYANGSSDYFEYFVRHSAGANSTFNGGTWDTGGEIARFGAYKILT